MESVQLMIFLSIFGPFLQLIVKIVLFEKWLKACMISIAMVLEQKIAAII